MSCPACGAALLPGQDRCPACAPPAPLPVEGTLAPDPSRAAHLSRFRPPGEKDRSGALRRDAWKDEVKERVRHRRDQRGAQPELPLFVEDSLDAESAAARDTDVTSTTAGPRREPEAADGPPSARLDDALADLSIRGAGGSAAKPTEPSGEPGGPGPPDDGVGADEWEMGDDPAARLRPTERPAATGERISAGAIDLAFLLVVWCSVVLLASGAGHVPLRGLLVAWPYLAAYLVFLGLVYAVYFTGTTGQTLGKIVVGLRVVDTMGRPPSAWKALLRAVLGAVSILAAFAGFLPAAFDPARRALHDRVLKTRVIRG